jgi:hypothetical protein
VSAEWLLYAGIAGLAIVMVRLTTQGVWRAIGSYRVRRSGSRPLRASVHRIWREPGAAAALDPVHGPGGPGGVPMPPFHFVKEHSRGSQPCVSVRDRRGRRWRVKWGAEVHSETFAVRVAWACGYFAEVTHFVPAGIIEGAGDLQRAKDCIGAADGSFQDARFELEDPAVTKMFEEHSWAWNDNPFLGSRELNGLKVVVMLLSNWDTKDRRDVARGSNTAIFEEIVAAGTREAHYLLTDWGGSMGRWGSNVVTRGRWDPEGFAAQTPQFVTGVANGFVSFGYAGQRTADVAHGIPVADVQWLHPYLERVNRDFLTRALRASGASDDEAAGFTAALLERIRQLGAVQPDATGSTARSTSDP